MASSDFTKLETWKLRGTIDAQCAKCEAIGVELRFEVAMEGRAKVVEVDGERTFEMGLRVIEGNVPVELACVACGNVVKYGKAAEVQTDG